MVIGHVTYNCFDLDEETDILNNASFPTQDVTTSKSKLCLDFRCYMNMYKIVYDSTEKQPLILTRRNSDREEIRKRLALGNDDDDDQDYYCGEPVSRKPSLSTRLQSGMNLQICFMNETASDHESPAEDAESDGCLSEMSTSLFSSSSSSSRGSSLGSSLEPSNLSSNISNSSKTLTDQTSKNSTVSEKSNTKTQRPSFFFAKQRSWRLRPRHKHEQPPPVANEVSREYQQPLPTEDFYTKQARLQAEARLALAQAKEMAKMQMEIEKQKKCKKSPIADMVGLPDNRHHINKQLLLDMNVAQLQVIVNDLHSQIESLNEDLVHLLLSRDDLHMEQDSMLVDIEDLTRYLGAKDGSDILQQQSRKATDCQTK